MVKKFLKVLEFLLNLGNSPSILLYEAVCVLCRMLYEYTVLYPGSGIIFLFVLPIMWLCLIGMFLGLWIEKKFNLHFNLPTVLKWINSVFLINTFIVSFFTVSVGLFMIVALVQMVIGID